MQIAIVGTGSIGSALAFHLSRAGHEVTVVARGARLAQLEQEKAIVKTSGERAEVRVSAALDLAIAWDLVLVTVLAHQLEPVLPSLSACAAKQVMFMFNTFESLDPLRDAVGASRFVFGFPSIVATLTEGKLTSQVVTVGQLTTVSDPAWAKAFTAAGIKSVTHDDMQSWLRTHAALFVPLMSLGIAAYGRGAGVSIAEARRFALAMREGFALVRRLGQRVTPAPVALIAMTPAFCTTLLLWLASRTRAVRDLGAIGPSEARALIDAMTRTSPDTTTALLAIRP